MVGETASIWVSLKIISKLWIPAFAGMTGLFGHQASLHDVVVRWALQRAFFGHDEL
jgi:hypothetical protein